MKKLIAILMLSCLVADAAHISFDLNDFMTGDIKRRKIVITPVSPPYTNSGTIVTSDPVQFYTDTSGLVTVSNIYGEYVYQVDVHGPAKVTTFNILVPDTNIVIEADTIVTTATNSAPGAIVGFTQSQANGRFVLKTNGWASGTTLTNITNLWLVAGTLTSNYVWTLTNTTTGAGEWRVAPGSAGGEVNVNADASATNATVHGLTYSKSGVSNLLRSVSAGVNITITNEGTNLVIASTAVTSIETNANQFGASPALTLKSGLAITNANHVGTLTNTTMEPAAHLTGKVGTQTAMYEEGNFEFLFASNLTAYTEIWLAYAGLGAGVPEIDGNGLLIRSGTVSTNEIGFLDGIDRNINTALDNLDGSTNAINSTVSGHTTDISNLQGATNAIDGTISGHTTDISNLQGATNGIMTRISNLDGSTNALNSGKQNVDAGLTALSSLGAGLAATDGADGWSARGFSGNQFALSSSTYYIKSGAQFTNIYLSNLTASRVLFTDAQKNVTNYSTATWLDNLNGTGALTNITQLGTTNLATSYSVLSNIVNGVPRLYSLVEGSNITIDQNATGLVINATGGASASNYVALSANYFTLSNHVEMPWEQSAGGALTWAAGNRQIMNLVVNTNINGPDMSGVITNREPMILRVQQDATGSRTFTHNGTAYTVRTAANEWTDIEIEPGPDGSTNVNPEVFNSAGFNASIDDNTGTGLVVFNDSPVFVEFDLGSAGVRFSEDGDGALTWTGLGDGNDEAITFNLDDTANEITVSSTSGVDTFNFSSIGLEESGNAVPNATDHLGFFAATTSAQLAGVVSDETGTGRVVLGADSDLTGATEANQITVTNQIIFLSDTNFTGDIGSNPDFDFGRGVTKDFTNGLATNLVVDFVGPTSGGSAKTAIYGSKFRATPLATSYTVGFTSPSGSQIIYLGSVSTNGNSAFTLLSNQVAWVSANVVMGTNIFVGFTTNATPLVW